MISGSGGYSRQPGQCLCNATYENYNHGRAPCTLLCTVLPVPLLRPSYDRWYHRLFSVRCRVGELYEIVKSSSNLVIWLFNNVPCGGVINPELELLNGEELSPSQFDSEEYPT
jgi:hypothetical protein